MNNAERKSSTAVAGVPVQQVNNNNSRVIIITTIHTPLTGNPLLLADPSSLFVNVCVCVCVCVFLFVCFMVCVSNGLNVY